MSSHQQSQAELDYEKQFQDDLAKATALSLEQQALDEYRRNKKYGRYERTQSAVNSASTDTSVAATNYYAQLRERYGARNLSGSSDGGGQVLETAATTVRPNYAVGSHPRRHSEVASFPAAITAAATSYGRHHHNNNNNNAATNSAAATLPRSRTPPATSTPESDLISFSSPTSKQPETPGGGSKSFEQLIEDLHKLQATNHTALVPLGPTAAAPNAMQHNVYRSAPPTAIYIPGGPPQFTNIVSTSCGQSSQAAGMQLVPFTPPPPGAQKVPLTNDELQKLYNMPHAPHQSALQQRLYMPYAANQYGVHSAPSTAGVAAYPPQHFPPQYGFKNPTTGVYYQPQPTATAAVSAATATTSILTTVDRPREQTGQGLFLHGTVERSAGTAPKTHSITSIGNSANDAPASIANMAGGAATSSATVSGSILRRQTPPARKVRNPGADLIDLSHEEDSRVSVLEAFDPLLNEDNGGSRCVKHPKQ